MPVLKPTIVNGEWVNLPPPRQDHSWLKLHASPDRYTLQRGDDEHRLELSYQIERGPHASVWGINEDALEVEWPVLTSAWHDGRVFHLTDLEIAEAEEWIAGELAK